MKITSEDDVLKLDVRARAIAEILGPENLERKRDAYKRYLCYKDLTPVYVREKLLKQFKQNTVDEMQYAMSNIAFVRKIIDKIARVYSFGVERKSKDAAGQEAVNFLENVFNINSLFKKTNRFLELEKNCIQYIVPVQSEIPGEADKKTLLPRVILPFFYDAIEDAVNHEKPMAYILSDLQVSGPNGTFGSGLSQYVRAPIMPGDGSRTTNAWIPAAPSLGDGVNQTIADNPNDDGNDRAEFIWWTNGYHFTTNIKGEILGEDKEPLVNQDDLPEELIKNPIGMLPIVNYAKDQDGHFWAIGGADLTEGAILLNALITHIIHLGVVQGYGQLVLTGKDIPKTLNVGPSQAITLEWQNADDPKPEFAYHSANPPLAELKTVVEMYVALLLTSNNLSTAGVASQLGGGVAFQSGVAIMLDKAESIEDVKDQRQVFLDKEVKFWTVMYAWMKQLKVSGELESRLDIIKTDKVPEMSLIFGEPQVIQTESERIATIKSKKDLGLSTQLDLLGDLYPDLSEEQLKAKLKEILEEKMQAVLDAQKNIGMTNPNGVIPNGSEESNGDTEQDNVNPGPGTTEDDAPDDESAD